MSSEIVTVDGTQVEKARIGGAELAKLVNELVIDSDEKLALAGEIGSRIARAKKFVEGIFERSKRAAKKAHSDICADEKRLLAEVSGPEATLRKKMSDYETDRQRRIADQRKVEQAQAVRKAEDDIIGQAERLAKMAEVTGDVAFSKAAEQVLSTPIITMPATTSAPAKVENTQFRTEYEVEVVNLAALCLAVGTGAVVLPADEAQAIAKAFIPWLKRKAKSDGEAYSVPGTVAQTRKAPTFKA